MDTNIQASRQQPPNVERNTVGLALVALFTIAVIGVAASSIHTAPIQSGFGIEGGSGANETVSAPSSGGGFGGGGGDDAGFGGLGGGGRVGSSGDSTGGSVSVVVLVVLAAVAIAGSALVFWATGDDAPSASPASSTPETTDLDDDRSAASAPVEPTNEVYRAWWEMAKRTDISQVASRSPAEFATAAVEEGMDREAVAELTRLFRAVRYGGVAITDDTERRATAALDRVRGRSAADDREMDR